MELAHAEHGAVFGERLVPAARPTAYARIIQAQWTAMPRRRDAVNPRTKQATIADPNTSRRTYSS